MQRHKTEWCFPKVGDQESLSFTDLKEIVMTMKQKGETIGNDAALDGERLVIVTGANQGGKSTFLRSIGIAQVMMQCGLMVPAKRYQSGLYPNFFTHFTRREDSAMNSGRLDEELRRMDQIVSNLGENSLLLLNESFATTTEKEGSAIAYDILRALKEEGVRILTVTHLLSFAQRVYEEAGSKDNKGKTEMEAGGTWSNVAFLSAQRLSDGTRTYKILPHAPEMTSFGLELYDEVLSPS
jgi:DNA mismatch repair ATPase MutS